MMSVVMPMTETMMVVMAESVEARIIAVIVVCVRAVIVSAVGSVSCATAA